MERIKWSNGSQSTFYKSEPVCVTLSIDLFLSFSAPIIECILWLYVVAQTSILLRHLWPSLLSFHSPPPLLLHLSCLPTSLVSLQSFFFPLSKEIQWREKEEKKGNLLLRHIKGCEKLKLHPFYPKKSWSEAFSNTFNLMCWQTDTKTGRKTVILAIFALQL